MKARGYRFTTVTEGLNVGHRRGSGAAESTRAPYRRSWLSTPRRPTADQWRGGALLWTVRLADGMVYAIAGLFLVVGLLTIGAYRAAAAARHPARPAAPQAGLVSWGPPVTEPVSVIVPAYNEKEGIEAAVRSLAGGDYPEIEVVVVDDGSTDGTAALVERLGAAQRPGDPGAQRRQGERAEHRHRAGPARPDRHGRRRHHLRAGLDPDAGAAVRRPGGRRGGRQRQGRQPQQPGRRSGSTSST